jgi:hypothetical protein
VAQRAEANIKVVVKYWANLSEKLWLFLLGTIRDKIPVETLLRQFIDETQEIEVTRVEKTLNTVAKPLDSLPINTNPMNPNPIESLELPNQSMNQGSISPMNQGSMTSMNQGSMTSMNQGSMTSMNQGSMTSMNQGSMTSMNPSMNQMNFTQNNSNFNQPKQFDSILSNSMNFDEPQHVDSRRQSISFNPEPSILEIEPREINSEKLDGISFEDLDSSSAPVSLDFEEL